ncbi:hypothetical protein [Nostoc sp. CHAB 5715]|nr:hypothetical protein [Nostoc sp. CHAB 5715]
MCSRGAASLRGIAHALRGGRLCFAHAVVGSGGICAIAVDQ